MLTVPNPHKPGLNPARILAAVVLLDGARIQQQP